MDGPLALLLSQTWMVDTSVKDASLSGTRCILRTTQLPCRQADLSARRTQSHT